MRINRVAVDRDVKAEGPTLILGIVVLFLLPVPVVIGVVLSPWLGIALGCLLAGLAVGVRLPDHFRVPRFLVGALGLTAVFTSIVTLLGR